MNTKAYELFQMLKRHGFAASYADHGNGIEVVLIMGSEQSEPFDSDPRFTYKFDIADEFRAIERITQFALEPTKGKPNEIKS